MRPEGGAKFEFISDVFALSSFSNVLSLRGYESLLHQISDQNVHIRSAKVFNYMHIASRLCESNRYKREWTV